MQTYLLDETNVLRRHLAAKNDIYHLVEDLDGDNHWQSVTDADAMGRPHRPPLTSPKRFFFSEQENTFTFDGQIFRETLPNPNPFVLFGVHSCDLSAIAYQDQYFSQDPYYQARRKQALLVGLDCMTPCDGGFCSAVNAGPGVNQQNADLILHRYDNDQWLLLVSSEKGEQAISGMGLKSSNGNHLSQRQQRIDACIDQFPDAKYIHSSVRALLDGAVPEKFWDEAGIQCLSCSGCTSLCPTCSCYATREIKSDRGSTEQRFWDSCLYESFQREASNNNPSHDAGKRVKRFWTHKFNNEVLNGYGRHGCVGCGRCEKTCPGVIGAQSIMKRMVNYVEFDTNTG